MKADHQTRAEGVGSTGAVWAPSDTIICFRGSQRVKSYIIEW